MKGVSAAFTAPAGLSIITTSFPQGPVRNKALAVCTATGAVGFSLGLVVGGLLTEIGWRWVFLLPVPVALVVLAAALRFVPDSGRPEGGRRTVDLAGATAITAGMLLLVYSVVEAPAAGWASARTLASLAGAAALIALFAAIERRVPAPLVRLGILRSPSLVRANLGAMALFGSWVGFQFIATLYLGFALAFGPLNIAATNGIEVHEQGLAGGLVNTSFQFGGALVLAVVTAVSDAAAGGDGTAESLMDGYRPAVAVSLIVAVLGLVATAARRRRSPRPVPELVEG